MQVTVERNDKYVLAKVTGPIVGTTRDPLAELFPLMATSGARVVLDLSGSERVNSQGISDLVRLVAHANSHGGRVVLCGLTPYVDVVFTTTRLDRFFEIEQSQEEAIARCTA